MLINADFMRRFRPVSRNIAENRVNVYIREAEQLDILPALGAELFQRLDKKDNTEFTPEELKLLEGGYYDDGCGTKYFEGVRAALAYLAYARLVRNHSTNVTPFGVVVKEADDSSPAGVQTVAAVALDAQRIGAAYLQNSVAYWATVSCPAGGRPARRRFVAVGD